MKKLLLGIGILLIIFVACTYIFIPDLIPVKSSLSFPANKNAVYRLISSEQNWSQWWPAKTESASDTQFVFRNRSYSLAENQVVSVIIDIKGDDVNAKTSLQVIPDSPDSINLDWQGKMASSYNPFARLNAYFKAKDLERDLDSLESHMRDYFLNPEKVYGIYIRQEQVLDSFLVSMTGTSKGYPTTAFIYSLFDQLKKQVAANGATVTGFPMMNAKIMDSNTYITRVALPISKQIQSTGNVEGMRMVTGAKILTSEITGDAKTVVDAFQKMGTFVSDYKLSAPAIPFFSLITDRRAEPDSTRWLTKIYYPIM